MNREQKRKMIKMKKYIYTPAEFDKLDKKRQMRAIRTYKTILGEK